MTDKSEYYQQLFHRFAGQAMEGILSRNNFSYKPEQVAKLAISYADALMDLIVKKDGAG